MAKSRQRRQRIARFVSAEERKQIRAMAKLKPSLKPLVGKKSLTSAQAAQLTSSKKQLRYSDNLRPITARQEKLIRKAGKSDLLVSAETDEKGKHKMRGVRAIRLRNTSPNARVTVSKKGVIVTSNGRRWEYHPVPQPTPGNIAAMGTSLLERGDVRQVALWTNKGRVNEGWADVDDWESWVFNEYEEYSDASEFTQGVAAQIR